jgi:hypothetical protein
LPKTHVDNRVWSQDDAPLIGERAARRGRNHGDDEYFGVKSSSSVRVPASRTPPPTPRDRYARGKRRDRDARPSVYLSVFVANNDAPLIGERAATRWRRAMDGGDEGAGVANLSRRNARGERRDRDASLVDNALAPCVARNVAPLIDERAGGQPRRRSCANRQCAWPPFNNPSVLTEEPKA